MSRENGFVIVGGGLAAGKAAEELRRQSYDGPLVLIGDEAERPYIRPPLSKGYLLGKEDRESIFVHSEDWYREHDVELMTGTRVTAVDAHTRQVELTGGRRMSYTKLLLATGSSPRRLSVPGADLDNVLYLRRVGDSERLKAAFTPGAGSSSSAAAGSAWRRPRRPGRPGRW
jgi:3-phenylpropionate/trans-cinnamate dioxygenase ferredoxin reductase component